jgi:hypothetical protein
VTDTVPTTEMPASAPSSTGEIDLAIAVAAVAIGTARRAAERCPSAENAQRLAAAVAAVDALLDRRLAAAV